RREAVTLIGSASIPDHGSKMRLTVIGPAPEREAVLRDVANHAELARWKDRLIVAGYEPGHWHVARVGFVTTGKPTIYLPDAGGLVLHRQDDYQGGAEGLARALQTAVDRLRKPDPNYDPGKDPDARKPVVPSVTSVPWSVWALAGASVVCWYLGRRKQ